MLKLRTVIESNLGPVQIVGRCYHSCADHYDVITPDGKLIINQSEHALGPFRVIEEARRDLITSVPLAA